jgi:hypothetical protein
MMFVSLIGFTVGVFVHNRRAVMPRVALPAASAAGSAYAGSELVESVHLLVDAMPPNAQVVVDDVVMPQNPWRGSFPRGSTHTVRAVAPNHAPKTETVTLNATTHLNMILDRQDGTGMKEESAVGESPFAAAGPSATVPAAAVGRPPPPPAPKDARPAAPAPAAPPAAPRAAPAAPTATADVFGGGKAPSRAIDQKTPYE